MERGLINKQSLINIGNAIREKSNTDIKYTPSEMPNAILNIAAGGIEPTPEALTLTGDCSNWISHNSNKWFFSNYKNKMHTDSITNGGGMFEGLDSNNVPFILNFETQGQSGILSLANLFYNANITEAPKISIRHPNIYPFQGDVWLSHAFENSFIIDIPSNYLEYMFKNLKDIDGESFKSLLNFTNMFSNTKLQNQPRMCFLYNYKIAIDMTNMFSECYYIKELDLPVLKMINDRQVKEIKIGYDLPRLRHCTFDKEREFYNDSFIRTGEFVYDFSNNIGYSDNEKVGVALPKNKQIKDKATYDTLKNDPDAWTADYTYSLYNHDSALETIKTLPNYEVGCTIKFKGDAGSNTDGGAISTLTAQELEIAKSKGFTVEFV